MHVWKLTRDQSISTTQASVSEIQYYPAPLLFWLEKTDRCSCTEISTESCLWFPQFLLYFLNKAQLESCCTCSSNLKWKKRGRCTQFWTQTRENKLSDKNLTGIPSEVYSYCSNKIIGFLFNSIIYMGVFFSARRKVRFAPETAA